VALSRPLVFPDCDITAIVRVCDDEERVGHVVRRLARHLDSLGLRHEILVADEGSGDNTVAVAALLRPAIPALEVLHTDVHDGFRAACERARGRTVLLYDARTDAALGPVGFALDRLREGRDVVAIGGRYLMFRRTRAWRAFDSLPAASRGRDPAVVEKRFLRRARSIGLSCMVTERARRTPWRFLRDTFGLVGRRA
jgi:hypothetical protein